MSYSMWLGRLYDMSIDELNKLKIKHQENIKEIDKQDWKRIMDERTDNVQSVKEIEDVIKEKELEELKKSLVVTDEHKKLLKEMEFIYYEKGGDYVFIGVEGKRPFGNSDIYNDVARILKWRLPNSELSNKQLEKAEQLLKELPIALNKIIKDF